MPPETLNHKNIVIWGTGKEGRAAETFIKQHYTPASITFVDETANSDPAIITTPEGMDAAINSADVLVKSPGVSLYHPLVARAKRVTSLLNLWLAHRPQGRIIAITGTKGKSTTSSLLGHVLTALGYKTAVLGNIGVPVTEAPEGMDFLVLETSSYQSANFEGELDIAAITSLYPEHLNWHGTLEQYYRDKLAILEHAKTRIIHPQVRETWPALPQGCITCTNAHTVPNAYLARTHNLANVGMVLAIIEALGLDSAKALAAMETFKGLPHRQEELGTTGGILFVDDSIATTPQAAIAAMEAYRALPLSIIVGGYDRGIDYTPLVNYVAQNLPRAVITLGQSGERILAAVKAAGYQNAFQCQTMEEAVEKARACTPAGGAILLSPAAPSFGMFRDYIVRGQAFAKAAGFDQKA